MGRVLQREELKRVVEELRRQGKKIAFTNGCFDIIHLGHIRYLREAKSKGDVLIVGLNSDESVRKIKGDKRPILPEEERAEILASLNMVDFVVIFNELVPDELIKIVKPDVHIKGGDYSAPDELPEAELVRSLGGEVHIAQAVEGKSTTNIIETILERFCEK
ncbi:D-glycero-beta-D-manno-heptose 1-phosphate adenylyltransferase [bacterium]|nr:D-glycero-beta-D-manno-heptose 1-phosphate adenylyltransferase [bacterium]